MNWYDSVFLAPPEDDGFDRFLETVDEMPWRDKLAACREYYACHTSHEVKLSRGWTQEWREEEAQRLANEDADMAAEMDGDRRRDAAEDRAYFESRW